MKKLSILVVDDDPVIRRLLEQRLKNAYDVQVVEDGYQADSILRKEYFDVVLTDLVMPGEIGGIEVLEISKDIYPNIEVILITAHSSVDTAVEAMKKGAADYLEKPINFDELFLRLDKIANVQTILKSALDLQQAMDVTEQTAAETIQNLEMEVTRLQSLMDKVETILLNTTVSSEDRVDEALNTIETQH